MSVVGMSVKVCGITRAEDARAAAALGAAALGFVLWSSSPRRIRPARIAEITRGVDPFVARVGVCVNAPPDEVADAVRVGGLDVVQLHGDESPQEYAGVGARLIKAVTLTSDADVDLAARLPEEVAVLVDASDPVRRGGTGRAADWHLAARLARRRPVILAGGLDATSVGDAVRAVRPAALDVSSGVEASPGIKSPERLEAFFSAVRAAGGVRP
jgi:phosphoribosylanthranilate isomerase